MIFIETELADVWIVDVERHEDERGFFAHTFSHDEFADRGLPTVFAQCATSWNRHKGTLRGMHYQRPPLAEVKLVRCTRGEIFDVVIDLRDDSPTYCRWIGVELRAESRRAVLVPDGCAHGTLSLADDTEVFYQINVPYSPELQAGVRWNDPAFRIEWPLSEPRVSKRDASFPDFVR